MGLILLAISAFFYILHYLIFRDSHHIFIYLIGDIAFVFIDVLLVTLIIESLLEDRDKKLRRDKLNMVIGAFFSEVGATLLEILSRLDQGLDEKQNDFMGDTGLSPAQIFSRVARTLSEHRLSVDVKKVEWEKLRIFLVDRRSFMLGLLENQNLLEHESFTDTLWAVFHLTEELNARKGFDGLPETDYQHLSGDANRVYGLLAGQWLDYMGHLRDNYPYLFSLALRMNPFNRNASPVVKAA